MPAKTSLEKKMAILRLVNDTKDILYGEFTSELENRMKIEAWEEILTVDKSLELVCAQRHIRDQLYSIWKTNAFYDKLKKTGARGGKEVQLDEAEKYIVEVIVGRSSPVTEGEGIGESGRPQPRSFISDFSESFLELEDEEYPRPSTSQNKSATSSLERSAAPTTNPKPSKRQKCTVESELDQIQKRKREMQVDVLEIQLYKHKLECLKLERELGIETSKFTENLISSQAYDASFDEN